MVERPGLKPQKKAFAEAQIPAPEEDVFHEFQ
jgi:hypothetical protein